MKESLKLIRSHLVMLTIIGMSFLFSISVVYSQEISSSKYIEDINTDIDEITSNIIKEIVLNNNMILFQDKKQEETTKEERDSLSLGINHFVNERYRKARELLEAIKKDIPKKNYYLGLIYFNLNNWRTAISFLNKVTDNPRYRSSARYFIFASKIKLRNYNGARKIYFILSPRIKNKIKKKQIDVKLDSLRKTNSK